MSESVFAAVRARLFQRYRITIEFRDKVMGGTPQDPKLIEGWIRKNMGGTREEEMVRMAIQTMRDNGEDVPDDVLSLKTFEELEKASASVAAKKQTNGFKRDKVHGLYLEGRVIKAAIKENTNILFAGDRWGKTKKGPKSFVAERVFVVEDKIFFGKHEPDGVDLFIGHVTGPKGPQSNITYYEYMERPTVSFTVIVLKDEVGEDDWPQIWVASEENGLGALRSQSFGRYFVTKWQKLDARVTDAEIKAMETYATPIKEQFPEPVGVLVPVR